MSERPDYAKDTETSIWKEYDRIGWVSHSRKAYEEVHGPTNFKKEESKEK